MLNKSTALSARMGSARRPVALSEAREKATSMAAIKSHAKITTQASSDWEEVVGKGTPKNTVEVEDEARAPGAAEAVREESVGQAVKGRAGAALLPPSWAGAVPAALKL